MEMQSFPRFANEQDLRSAIESACSRYGQVTSLKIYPATPGPRPRCLCLLRLDSAVAEFQVESILPVFRFAGDLGIMLEVDEGWTGPRV